jgi:DNA-binding transcriptional MerR regulator
MTQMEVDELLSTTEVARHLGVQPYRISYLLNTGRIREPRVRVAGKRAWTADDVEVARKVLAERRDRHASHEGGREHG